MTWMKVTKKSDNLQAYANTDVISKFTFGRMLQRSYTISRHPRTQLLSPHQHPKDELHKVATRLHHLDLAKNEGNQ